MSVWWLNKQADQKHCRWKLGLFSGLFFVWLLGFILFYVRVLNLPQSYAITDKYRYQAAVALTGGAGRIQAATDLLRLNVVEKVLISGVHQDVTQEEIRRMTSLSRAQSICCLLLDKQARNTQQNAEEITKWVEQEGFASIILVSSDYHIPRALYLVNRRMPEVRVTVLSVNTGPDPINMMIEYHKYMISLVAGWIV